MKENQVIRYPVVTENSVNLIEGENKLTFIVNIKANKFKIKRAIETLYDVQVKEINTMITQKGLKKAYVKLKPEFKASDLAVKLGIL